VLVRLSASCTIAAPEVFEFADIVELHRGKGFETENTGCGKTQQEELLRVCIFVLYVLSLWRPFVKR